MNLNSESYLDCYKPLNDMVEQFKINCFMDFVVLRYVEA